MAKPFLKWAGGKRQLLPVLKDKIKYLSYNRYIEPFIGGGALFFDLEPSNGIINDINKDLINTYKVVRDKPLELIQHLKKHINTKEYFLKIRALDREPSVFEKLTDIEKASRFIFLNRTCFNGLYRVNNKGYFNTSYGNYKNPDFIQEETIKQVSKILKNTLILNKSVFELENIFKKGDFVYFDPPYIPLNKGSFKSYNKEGFSLKEHEKLAQLCITLNKKGIKFLLSNSYTEETFKIYNKDNFNIQEVLAKRSISSNVKTRGAIKEVLISNF